MRTKLLTALGGLGLSLWFEITAVVLPYWWRVDSINADIGLFQFCNADPISPCKSTVSDANTRWLQAVQTLLIMAIIAMVICITITVLHIYLKINNKTLICIAAGLTVLGAILSISGLIVFASIISKTFPGGHFMIGFGLTIISIISAICSFGIIVFSLLTDIY